MTYIELLTQSNALLGDARHRLFFMLHDHHVLPQRFAPDERARRDVILLKRGWEAVKSPERA